MFNQSFRIEANNIKEKTGTWFSVKEKLRRKNSLPVLIKKTKKFIAKSKQSFSIFFFFFSLDPDYESGSTDLVESGSSKKLRCRYRYAPITVTGNNYKDSGSRC
jgi:hypothetical protein